MSGSYKVELNMTITSFVAQNIGIKRITPVDVVQNGGDVVYRVTFPVTNYVPEVTSVTFNTRVYCMSNPQTFSEFTSLTAYDFFSVSVNKRKPYPLVLQEERVPAKLNKHRSPSFLDFTLPHTKVTENTYYYETVLTQTSPNIVETTTPSLEIVSTAKPINRLIETIVFENRNFEKFECGVTEDTQALIVHGKPTTEGQYPWLVAMFHLQENGEYKFKCAGSLISEKHVISAAHCVRKDRYVNIPLENIILVLGKHNIKSWAVRSEIRDIKSIYVHPDYVKPSDADISILVMYKAVEFTEKIKPVCLWHEETESITGIEGVVVGWGRDEFFNEYVPEPRELSMPVVSQEDCLRADERFLKITSNRTFCAGNRKGSGACTGDSGGGFIMKRNGRWTIRGIVSSALVDSNTRTCDVNNYMVFSDVAKYKLWIDRVMNK
ncbi:hypothetical protein RN001_010280 [Aquatica leii]|uniref:Peptidase S1 domain-containing protein n=1 Tax=Aquatica leii TaxID=1421715 RepID=A0AAN7PUM2_9COLE|nr:hypothetical protein RN001_010280 [Aquatica leii]